MTAPYLPRIQALRFAAAAMVLFGHAQVKVAQVAGLDVSQYTPLGHANFFAGGVDIFFVLSGFIMHTVTAQQFGRPGAPAQFFLRRLARIAPTYWFFTSAMLASVWLLGGHVGHTQLTLEHTLASYFFVPVHNAYGELYPLLILGWTLNFEMFFYAVLAVALHFRRRRGWLLVGLVVGGGGVVGLLAPFDSAPLAFWCKPLVFEFLFGVGLAHARAQGLRCSNASCALLAVAGAGLLYAGALQSTASPYWPARFIFMGLPALLICAAAVLTHEAALVGRPMRLLVAAGDASYALYLSHPFVLGALAMGWRHTGLTAPLAFVALAVLCAVVVPVLFHRTVEKPVTDALNRWIARARPRTRQPQRA